MFASFEDGRVVEEDLRVLLIEDDAATAEMYRARLSSDGYAVTVATDGEAGLSSAMSDPPDLIYLDLRLPRMDGFEVLERLRATESTASTPVVILTNYSEPEMRERGLRMGALEFLLKSDVTPARVSETVERLADRRSPIKG